MTADASHASFLQDAQQLCLRGKTEGIYFIQQERSPSSHFKQTAAGLVCAGKAAPLIAEQLSFDQCLGKGGAVDADKRSVSTRAKFVNGVCDYLFAGARGAGNEHRAVRWADPLHD